MSPGFWVCLLAVSREEGKRDNIEIIFPFSVLATSKLSVLGLRF